jgi:hypothetical protein
VNKDDKKEFFQKLFEEKLVCSIIPQCQSHDEVER